MTDEEITTNNDRKLIVNGSSEVVTQNYMPGEVEDEARNNTTLSFKELKKIFFKVGFF